MGWPISLALVVGEGGVSGRASGRPLARSRSRATFRVGMASSSLTSWHGFIFPNQHYTVIRPRWSSPSQTVWLSLRDRGRPIRYRSGRPTRSRSHRRSTDRRVSPTPSGCHARGLARTDATEPRRPPHAAGSRAEYPERGEMAGARQVRTATVGGRALPRSRPPPLDGAGERVRSLPARVTGRCGRSDWP